MKEFVNQQLHQVKVKQNRANDSEDSYEDSLRHELQDPNYEVKSSTDSEPENKQAEDVTPTKKSVLKRYRSKLISNKTGVSKRSRKSKNNKSKQ